MKRRILNFLLVCMLLAGVLPFRADAETGSYHANLENTRDVNYYSFGLDAKTYVEVHVSGTYVRFDLSQNGRVIDVGSEGDPFYGTLEAGSYSITVYQFGAVVESVFSYHLQVYVEDHTHNFEYTRDVKPTCTKRGYSLYTCSCGEKEERNYVARLPHTEVTGPTVAPTCSETGREGGMVCSICEIYTEEANVIPATGLHTEIVVEGKRPTCTETGLADGIKCSVCNLVILEQKILPTNDAHSNEVTLDAKSPNCLETGLTEGKKCNDCGATTLAQEQIPSLGHSFRHGICIRCEGAYSSDVLHYGQCGADGDCVNWFLEPDGTLRIRGEGKIRDYADYGEGVAPWYSFDDSLLKKIIIEDGVTRIGSYAFMEIGWHSGTYYEVNVILADSITEIGNGAFFRSGITAVSLPKAVTVIGNSAFALCNYLKEVVVPDNVTSFGDGVFGYCDNLESVKLSDKISNLKNAFAYCSNLKTFNIPKAAVTLEGAFEGCKLVTEAKLPDGVIDISRAFSGTALTEIEVPNSVTTMNRAFSRCSELDKVVLSRNIKEMSNAFTLTAIEDLYWPVGLTDVGKGAFMSCYGIENVYYGGTEAQWNALDFDTKSVLKDSVIHFNAYYDGCAEHTWDSGKVTKEATEETEGEKTFTCTVCGETETRVIPKLEHIHNYTRETTPATCDKEGYITYTCNCGDKKTDVIPAKDHDWDTGKETKAPTEEAEGEMTFTCTVCGETETRVIPKKEHTHNYYKDTVTPPTCVDEGYTTYKCDCGDEKTEDRKPAEGHKWNEGEITKEPTEEAEGEKIVTCDVCGETETRVIPKKEHVHDYKETVKLPTCVDEGYTTYKCDCGHEKTEDRKPAEGHKWNEGEVTKEPTEEAEGEKTVTCDVCGETEIRVIPKLEIPADGAQKTPGEAWEYDNDGIGKNDDLASAEAVRLNQTYRGRVGKAGDLADCYQIPVGGAELKFTVTLWSTTMHILEDRGLEIQFYDAEGQPVTPDKSNILTRDLEGVLLYDFLHTYQFASGSPVAYVTFSVKNAEKGNVYSFKAEATGEAPHVHNYTETVTPPTCEAEGYTTYTCACGDSYEGDYEEPLHHEYVYEDTEELRGTCVHCGETTYTDFITFAELKELTELPEEINLYYKGTGPLIIEKDLTLDDWQSLYADSLVVPEGVTLTVNDGLTGISVENLTVNGTLVNEGMVFVSDNLTVNGKIQQNLLLIMTDPTHGTATGTENILPGKMFEDAGLSESVYGILAERPLIWYCAFTSQAELESVAAKANASTDSKSGYVFEYQGAEGTTFHLTNSVALRESCMIAMGQNFVIDPGVILTSQGAIYADNGAATVKGTLNNEGYLEIDHTAGASLNFADSGTYSGNGELWVYTSEETYPAEAITGLDLSDFRIEEKSGASEDDTYRYFQLTYEATEEPVPPVEATITRVAGTNRIKTAIASADKLKAVLGVEKFQTIVVANAMDFPDALSGSYLAAVAEAPILLYANGQTLVTDYIRNNLAPGGIVYILGGEKSVSNEIIDKLSGIPCARVAGSGRFATSLAIIRKADELCGTKPDKVLICHALAFADSLSASATGLPILLVNGGGSLNADQKAYLESVRGAELYVIGGKASVSEEILTALNAYDANGAERVYGSGRELTSVEVAKKFFPEAKAVALASSLSFPDGLSGGPVAYAMNMPLLLTRENKESIAEGYVNSNGILEGYIIGGTDAVPDAIANAVFGIE